MKKKINKEDEEMVNKWVDDFISIHYIYPKPLVTLEKEKTEEQLFKEVNETLNKINK